MVRIPTCILRNSHGCLRYVSPHHRYPVINTNFREYSGTDKVNRAMTTVENGIPVQDSDVVEVSAVPIRKLETELR